MDINDIAKVIDEFYQDFSIKKTLQYVQSAKTTLPIIWFGNLEKYFSSNIKILTIGLNPSLREFDEERFPGVANGFELQNYSSVFDGLNKYFTYNPYKAWFSAYERVLSCSNWDATYGGKITKNAWAKNYAIHIDYFSAIATNPTWSRLDNIAKLKLQRIDLFDKLFEFLNPDIVLFSTSEDEICGHFKLLRTNPLGASLPTSTQNYIREHSYRDNNGKDILFIWGKANVKPFQGVRTDLLRTYFKFR